MSIIANMKGKGAQFNPNNPFSKYSSGQVHFEGIDEDTSEESPGVQLFYDSPQNVISKNKSQDIPFEYSINPYQGCEHGCVYCYARNSHTYWGFSSGLDFESKIVVKKNVAEKLEANLSSHNWKVNTLMLSGNTDCYQPIEKKLKLTRSILELALKYRNPVGIITKNSLVLRDLDILNKLAELSLVHVYFSINTLDEELRRNMEPRTASSIKKLEAIETLTKAGVPVGLLCAPVIPGLNHHEIPEVLRLSATAGAVSAAYTVVRLNGQLDAIFSDWIKKCYPDKAKKVLNQISELHDGHLNDSEWKRRMVGGGNIANIIQQLFKHSKSKYFEGRAMSALNHSIFRRGGSYNLFE